MNKKRMVKVGILSACGWTLLLTGHWATASAVFAWAMLIEMR